MRELNMPHMPLLVMRSPAIPIQRPTYAWRTRLSAMKLGPEMLVCPSGLIPLSPLYAKPLSSNLWSSFSFIFFSHAIH
ncbi:unnamed protein product [Protopolystoma xenopodis]|uniref:Uncharacterized protein n=1 Tax=Protopolystoma xenopodis TaxID=117903 RepID=A0A448XQ64_9PLAT|nr:unnamed protein product [Protopolystoma xenopodis]